jgi:hypothetical protein
VVERRRGSAHPVVVRHWLGFLVERCCACGVYEKKVGYTGTCGILLILERRRGEDHRFWWTLYVSAVHVRILTMMKESRSSPKSNH